MPIDMFPRTIENWLKIGRNVPIWRHQSARIEPCGDGSASRAETLILCGVAGVFGENGVVLLKE